MEKKKEVRGTVRRNTVREKRSVFLRRKERYKKRKEERRGLERMK